MVLKTLATWRPSFAVWLILLLPLLLKLPVFMGHVTNDPAVYTAGIGDVIQFRGAYPWIDPNAGFQTQALGKLSADTLLHGHMPWWNPYNGVGLPLVAEAQPGSLFLPFVLLHHFHSGFLWVPIILQIIAGLCTYLLLKQLRLTELAAVTGGLLYELNGTFAWLGLPAAAPIAFLPMLLLGTEYVLQRVNDQRAGGWWLVSLALAWSIYAGFPEAAYIDALFAGLWVLFRLPDVQRGLRVVYVRRLLLAALVGLACSVLQIFPFAHYVFQAALGAHVGSFAQRALSPTAAALTLVPRLFGPIFQFPGPGGAINAVWGDIGGYLPALQLAFVLLAIQLGWKRMLLAPLLWIVLCMGKTFGIHPVSDLMNLLPLVKTTAFYRYAPPSWEFASVMLVSMGIDAIQRDAVHMRCKAVLAFTTTAGLLSATFWMAWPSIASLKADHASAHYVRSAMIVLVLTLSVALVMLLRHRWRWVTYGLATLLVLDAAVAFAAPLRSAATLVSSDHAGVDYLRTHTGLQRTFTLGPMAPNYGAYFRVPQINHNYIPLSEDWAAYVKQHLDPAFDLLFTGNNNRLPGLGSPTDQLRARLPAYEEVAVKYVLALPGSDPLAGVTQPYKLVYGGPDMSIYELSGTKPYFEVSHGDCSVQAVTREAAKLQCAGAGELLRREAFFPGWSATLNGVTVSVRKEHEIFQSIPLVSGENNVVFSYQPPDYGLMLLVFWSGIAVLLLGVAQEFLSQHERHPQILPNRVV